MFETPVLYLIFNRVDTTSKVFARIKEIKPAYFYIAADGPRKEKEGEREQCEAVRKYVLDNIDWNCDVKTLFREQNLGCGKGVSSAITWFFENVEEGIILEDDCLPSISFFPFCSELLERYRNNDNVFVISGNNFQNKKRGKASYYFSAYGHVWGWASWRRAWNNYNFSLQDLKDDEFKKCLELFFHTKPEREYWYEIFCKMKYHPIDTWDYQWMIIHWINKGINILPNSNLITNIGFNEYATHTKHFINGISELDSFDISNLKHPEDIKINRKADLYTFKTVFSVSLPRTTPKVLITHFMPSIITKVIISVLKKFNILHLFGKRMGEENKLVLEKERIAKVPRFVNGYFNHIEKPIKFSDSSSFLFMYNEIFEKQIYRFKTTSEKPFIIDCGANIGLSILYFKQLYPNASILGFEPDPNAFETLECNIKHFDYKDVEVIEKGVWNRETTLRFFAEGADGGRISIESDKAKIIIINTVRLKDFLNRHIDFLKLDIEGAETVVLRDCADLLKNVDRIFVEFHSFIDRQQDLHDLLKVLSESGFRYNIQHVGVFSPTPFIEISSYLNIDNQLNIFAYRI